MAEAAPLSGPDFANGVSAADVVEGKLLLGHAGGEAVLLSRVGGKASAIGATCSHYGAPLIDGLVVAGTIRCPWHHACFSLKNGQNLRPPALFDLPRWRAEELDGRVFVREKLGAATPARSTKGRAEPKSVVIVGAGAAGEAVATTLRAEGYTGPVTLVDPDASAPVDRPNLSKDYLAGNAQPEWIPLRDAAYFAAQDIKLLRGREAMDLDAKAKRVTLDDGTTLDADAIVLATGAAPIRLDLPGSGPRVMYLRSLADSDAIIAAATGAKRVAVLGASFIGLEVAASLRARGLEVHVAAPESRPLERVLGAELGDFIRGLHESKGVVFHLGRKAQSLEPGKLVLDDGSAIEADFIVAGVGVRPRIALAEKAGLTLDRGVVVDALLQTSAPGIFAVGDIARWPYPHSDVPIRVEHWVVAQRQGRTAARNALGAAERFVAVPFFWSAHYDVTIAYAGHAEKFDRVMVEGDPAQRDCRVHYFHNNYELAMATIGRDFDSLSWEAALDRLATASL
jgi:NADPH-dependent 2,4-dienoyl-CoA reductase/sulfur reductase-like enzyme/nitrite reductase/ring-hydroxylating ferredoxin subunit